MSNTVNINDNTTNNLTVNDLTGQSVVVTQGDFVSPEIKVVEPVNYVVTTSEGTNSITVTQFISSGSQQQRSVDISVSNINTLVTVTSDPTPVITLNTPGPAGPQGPAGPPGTIDGVDISAFVLTSSYNPFTASYYVDSASFDARINAGGGGVNLGGYTTTSSFNLFTSSYYLDSTSFDNRIKTVTFDTGSLTTTSSFNQFTSSYYLDSTSFDGRIKNVTFDTSSLVTTSSFNSFTSSYTTGSFTGSFRGVFDGNLTSTASWAQSASQALTASYISTLRAAGASSTLQYNNGGVLAGDNNLYWTGANLVLNINTGYGSVVGGGFGLIGSDDLGIIGAAGDEIIALYDTSGIYSYAGNAYRFLGNTSTHTFTGDVDVTGSLRVSGSLTGSLFGTSSWAVTASYALNAGAGGTPLAVFVQSVPSTTWTFNHNLGITNPILTIYDISNNVIIPQDVSAVDTNTLSITFPVATTGTAVAGGGVYSGITPTYAISASYVLNALSSSFATTALLAPNYVLNSVTSSMLEPYTLNALTSSFVRNSQTSSMSVATSSFSLTSSYALRAEGTDTGSLLVTASAISNVITFTKGNSTTFAVTVATGSGFPFSGSAVITGSLVVSGSTLTVIGSGSSQPVFIVQGSQGELFSVTDSLSGSLFSVNDISGLPILEVFSDNTILQGSYVSPSLNTTVYRSVGVGSTVLYSIPTSSYDGFWFEYTVKSGSNARVGQIMGIWSGSAVNYMETTASSFGTTTGINFMSTVSAGNMIITSSATTAGWTIKGIVRAI